MKKALVVSCILALCGLVAIFGLAPRSAFAMDAALRIAVFARGVTKSPAFIKGRDARCSVGAALLEATSSAEAREKEICERSTMILKKDGDMELIATQLGQFWIQARDYNAIIEELAEQSTDPYKLAGRIGQGDVVLDCGANVGVVSRQALERGATVVAIEPGPVPLACLRRTFAKEIAASRLILYPKGVWDKEDELMLTNADDLASTAGSVALDRGAKGTKIQLTTIDQLVKDLKLARVDFIKMDIEGAEPNALRGAARTLAQFRPRLSISLEHRPTDSEQLPTLIQQLRPDYKLVCGPCTSVNGRVQPSVVFAN